MKTILYIHGMGGGGDSRIPSILREYFACHPERSPHCHPERSEGSPFPSVEIVCRTYSFDPEVAHSQILTWMEELHPDLVIGESLGALHALRISEVPRLLISPALNAPLYFEFMAWLTLIPGFSWLFGRIYRPREGDRQPLRFTFPVLRKYRSHRKAALGGKSSGCEESGNLHAFFGIRDHYRRSGVVSVRAWEKHFGNSFSVYGGTHFMEEEYIYSMLLSMICNILNIKQ